ncbi:MAG: putative Ig domain-containing protein, partial [Candidatus Woesearchaeota archaeon]
MVHKRYIKKNGKIYGPYYYKTVRDKGKVRSIYLGQSKDGKSSIISFAFFVIISLVLLASLGLYGLATNSVSGTVSELETWDTGDPEGGSGIRYSYDPQYAQSRWDVTFYANYSNSTAGPIVDYCQIRFNFSSDGWTGFVNMSYDPATKYYVFSRNFSYRGTHDFEVNCTNSSYDTLNVTDSFVITNSGPVLNVSAKEDPGKSYLKPQSCAEDTVCTYNLSENVTDYDLNDMPLSDFRMEDALSWLDINTVTGVITASPTLSNHNGTYNKSITVEDTLDVGITLYYNLTITAVNDAPAVTDPGAQTCTQDTLCTFNIAATDEEDVDESTGLMNFTDNSSLFVINPTTGVVSFTPDNDDVGTYSINITVNDSSDIQGSRIISLQINDKNDDPNITYACDNELEQTEDTPFTCWINATDIDQDETLTFSANYTWFDLNGSAITVVDGNASSLVNFTPQDSAVYQHWIIITVTDSESATDSVTINFSATNVNDIPQFNNATNQTPIWANVAFNYTINATDDDTLTQDGETIYYHDNTSLFDINVSTGYISFFPTNEDNGTHYVNITVNDSTGAENSTIIFFNVSVNYKPIINRTLFNESMTEGYLYTLNLSDNASDAEGDNITFADNTTLFNVNATTGIINFTANDSHVGTHFVNISVTDHKGAVSTYIFNFTVYNENDEPVLNPVSNVTDGVEGSQILIYVVANDSDLFIPNTDENLSFFDNSSLFNITKVNATTALINFTPSYQQAGFYWVNISVNDTSGAEHSKTIFINITNASAPPVFSYVCGNEENATEDTLFTCTINATDEDAGAGLIFTANYTWFAMNSSNITVVG